MYFAFRDRGLVERDISWWQLEVVAYIFPPSQSLANLVNKMLGDRLMHQALELRGST